MPVLCRLSYSSGACREPGRQSVRKGPRCQEPSLADGLEAATSRKWLCRGTLCLAFGGPEPQEFLATRTLTRHRAKVMAFTSRAWPSRSTICRRHPFPEALLMKRESSIPR
jgi:hypothetical protein